MRNTQKVFISDNEKLIAISEDFFIKYSDKQSNKNLNRLFLHDAETFQTIAVTKNITDNINYVAFHPSEPIIAIGIGSYDGGMCYYGNLILWNYDKNTLDEVLTNSIEVLHCSFNETGTQLLFTVTPEDDLNARASRISTYQIAFPLVKKVDSYYLTEIKTELFCHDYHKDKNTHDEEVVVKKFGFV